jgi:hypothetical protein
MTTYIAKIKHGPDENAITQITLEADDDNGARQYLRVLAMMLAAGDYTLAAREERMVEL